MLLRVFSFVFSFYIVFWGCIVFYSGCSLCSGRCICIMVSFVVMYSGFASVFVYIVYRFVGGVFVVAFLEWGL